MSQQSKPHTSFFDYTLKNANNPEDLFESFLCQLLQKELPGLRGFPKGKDGAIDLLQDGEVRTVIEAKHIGGTGPQKGRWSEVAKNLRKNLIVKDKPQKQYQPWFDADYPIARYYFCVSNAFTNTADKDALKKEITAFFHQELGQNAKFQHLQNLEVEVFDRNDLQIRLDANPFLARAYNKPWLGFTHLDKALAQYASAGLRRYISEDKLPYYSIAAYQEQTDDRRLKDEAQLLAALDQDEIFGLVFYGEGGIGKTRITYELGKGAARMGWLVLRVNSERKFRPDYLEPLFEFEDQKILLLVDYVETLQGFDDFIDTHYQYCSNTPQYRVRFIVNCRDTFYDASDKQTFSSEHLQIDMDPHQRSPWRPYQQAMYTALTGENESEQEQNHPGKELQSRPLRAAFMRYVQQEQLGDDLNALRKEPDFYAWTDRQIDRLSHNRKREQVLKQLAALFASLPITKRLYEAHLCQGDDPDLYQQMINQGWIGYDPKEDMLNSPHDVFADTILHLLAGEYRKDASRTQAFLDIFQRACATRHHIAFLNAFTRIIHKLDLSSYDFWTTAATRYSKEESLHKLWPLVLVGTTLNAREKLNWLEAELPWWTNHRGDRNMAVALAKVIKYAKTFPQTLLPLTQELITRHPQVKQLLAQAYLKQPESFRDTVYQEICDSKNVPHPQLLKAWMSQESPTAPLDQRIFDIFEKNQEHNFPRWFLENVPQGPWTLIAHRAFHLWLQEPYFTTFHDAFIVRHWLKRFKSPDFCEAWLDKWLAQHRSHPYADFLYRAWLESGGEPKIIQDAIHTWLKRHHLKPNASFVFRSWLGAGGNPKRIQAPITAWLERYQSEPQADFVMKAWLEAKGQPHMIQEFLEHWFKKHPSHPQADFLINAWLDAKGDTSVVQDPITHWLEENQTNRLTGFLFQAWLDAKGDTSVVQDPITHWLKVHQTTPEAQFVFKAWLDANGDTAIVQDPITQWLQIHQTTPEADFVFKAWLDAKGDTAIVQEPITQWLKVHQTAPEARFAFKAWLDANGDTSVVQDPITQWLQDHQTAPEAPFVFKAWLDANGDTSVVHDPITQWLQVHQTAPEAQFVFKAWLDADGSHHIVEHPIQAWLRHHQTDPEARFVFKAWLDIKGNIDIVKQPIQAWLQDHQDTPEARFVFKAWLDAKGSPHILKTPILNWLKRYGHKRDSSFIYNSWLKAGLNLSPIGSLLQNWFKRYRTSEDAVFIYITWLNIDAPLPFIQKHVNQWLGKNLHTIYTPSLLKAWLRNGADPAIITPHIKVWLKAHDENSPKPQAKYARQLRRLWEQKTGTPDPNTPPKQDQT